jgi:hypothetical protein
MDSVIAPWGNLQHLDDGSVTPVARYRETPRRDLLVATR